MKSLIVFLSVSLAASTFAQEPEPGKNFTNSQGMPMVWTGDFWIGEKEVTQEQFTKLGFKDESSWKKGDKEVAANNVSWVDAIKFCQALTDAEQGKGPAGAKYLLPTVAQWRKARQGKVKDMDGGVSEWCLDKFTPEMAKENRNAGIANAYVFMPASTAGLYCAMGPSWKSTGPDFAKGILPVPPIVKGTPAGKTSTDKGAPGTLASRLTAGEMGFRVVLLPASK